MKEIKIEVPEGYEIDKENSTFEKIVLKKKSDLPMSWKEVINIKGYYIDDYSDIVDYRNNCSNEGNKNTWPTKELAEAALALSQLLQLRDRWNGDWKPDWTDETNKYVIYSYEEGLSSAFTVVATYCLAFKSEELRDKFLKTFRDLIETAKPLL